VQVKLVLCVVKVSLTALWCF